MARNTNQGATYCRPELRGCPRKERTSDKYCLECGYKIRGENHIEGSHHRSKLLNQQ